MIPAKLLIILLFPFFLQQNPFPTDEYGKYTLQEVVELPGMSKEKLFENGLSFMKQINVLNSRKKHLSADHENLIITNKGSFYAYQYGSFGKAIDGAVEYDITLEIKDGRYRYTITNYTFNQYIRNRYGKFEPVNGKYTPLESGMSDLNKKAWEHNRQTAYDKSMDLIQNLNENMIFVEKEENKKIKKSENW